MSDFIEQRNTRPAAPRGTRTDSRVPPHNLDAEASLLGAMLLNEEPIGLASEKQLVPEDFYKPAHGHVYAAIRSLTSAAEAVDVVTVADELRKSNLLDELGGLGFLQDLQNATPSISSAGRYITIVRDTSILRRLIKGASEIADIGYSAPADIKIAIDKAEQIVFDIGDEQITDSLQKLHDLTGIVIPILESRYDSKSEITGVRSGYTKLDKLLSGFQPGTLNIVGARPAMGKSAFALGMAVTAARTTNQPVLFFSLEMSNTELTQRILSAEAQVDSDRLRRVNAADGPPAMVVIDYLQLMGGGDNESRQLEVAEISRGLKLLAREFKIPVVALSQLSRGIEQRQDRRPVLSDLRESGALEQDADVVMFLYREEAANAEAGLNDRGTAEVLVQKHRSGPTGNLSLLFNKAYTQFVDDPE